MSTIGSSYEQLHAAFATLCQQWHTTRDLWDDAVSRRFERDFWQEYERQVPPTLEEMQKLADAIAQARRQVR